MIYLKINEDMVSIEEPIYVRRQSNGVIVRCESPALAMGVVSPDEGELWQLAGRASLGEGFHVAELVTQAEYDEWTSLREQAPDPEDTDPEIPEGVDPETILTRAELTVKVTELDEAMQMLLSGVTEDA